MAKATIGVGGGLAVLGIVAYLGSGAVSATALIPTVFGLILAALGYAAQQPGRRALMMHIAVGVAIVGFLGSVPGLFSLPDLLAGKDVDRPWAIAAQSIMAAVLAVYLGSAIRSFVAARRMETT
ncbi:MAG: hypothetical protein M3179_02235 [Actinomycetota bacterium]|nr:hypothetical protein [Actinomycetota bacterium]